MKQYSVLRADVPDWSGIPAVSLAHTPWLAPCPIEARAQLCHNGQDLFVRMEAKEASVLATLTDPLDQVCEDSCLEFFFAPLVDDDRYFNFEFNPLGNFYMGFGGTRPTRVRQLPMNKEQFQIRPFRTEDSWGITFTVPGDFIRMYFPEFQLTGQAACNFYKCGENTEIPHYLSWEPMTSEQPDFHRRQDFGTIVFE